MIHIDHISKVYKIYNRRSDRLREWLSFGRKTYHKPFYALKDISLKVPSGEVYGIIGMNGAGKSTLLKVLTGTSQPTSGKVHTHGRIAALLELGAGFHPELSGRDNVSVNGKLLGLSQDEINAKMDDIKAFSELSDFFEKPVRTYSSGMYVRLAFALAASVKPDVLIIDEALSVGDAYFQQKCLKRILDFKKSGVTILFVSHDLQAVKMLCDHVALMDHGQILISGDPQDMLEQYNALLAKREGAGKEYVIERGAKDDAGRDRLISGNRKARITKVQLQDAKGAPVEALVSGQDGSVMVEVEFAESLDNPTIGIMIRDRLGYDVFGTNTAELFQQTGKFNSGERAQFRFRCPMRLGAGTYTITAAVHSSFTHVDECYEWIDRVLTFTVLQRADYRFLGVAGLEPKLEVSRV